MRRILASRHFVAAILAMASGMVLFYARPFPDNQLFLQVIASRAPRAFLSFRCLYNVFLFTTPYIAYLGVLSALYIGTLKLRRRIVAGRLPPYPEPAKRTDLFVVLGEIHNARRPGPSETPSWLVIPERGLFTGIAILGAVGSGKTSCCMFPYTEQILAYKADDPAQRIGGLILEVKGDFCRKVKQILERHGRGEDYIEISLDSEFRYNPLHNDLDAYALAFNIASLLNNLFGRGKEPFWQQAYTNLVKFIVLLHKVAYDYVTLFNVYECAISPPLLDQRIQEAEEIVMGRHFVAVTTELFGERAADLAGLGFQHRSSENSYVAEASPELRGLLRTKGIPFEPRSVLDPAYADPDKLAQLEAVKRWFTEDWRRIEPKLRTSIVEGISVFLSLFDDSPKVKRVFCPKRECYDPQKNAGNQVRKASAVILLVD